MKLAVPAFVLALIRNGLAMGPYYQSSCFALLEEG